MAYGCVRVGTLKRGERRKSGEAQYTVTISCWQMSNKKGLTGIAYYCMLRIVDMEGLKYGS